VNRKGVYYFTIINSGGIVQIGKLIVM
jgi:hypothetical protein